jgi:AraC-like DNA-binding protein
LNSASNDYPSVSVDPDRPYDGIRELYLYREPELIAAMLSGDRRTARKIINHILVHIYSVGEVRLELLKGLLLELVVMMARATVEAGVEQAEVLGMHFRHLSELAELNDDEQLASWLRESFERIFSAMEQQERTDSPPRIARALAYMRDHLDRDITRDEVAQHAGISPGHFSHLLRARTGHSFTERLRTLRIEAACGLLRSTDRPLAEIAAACGFCDQSYFTNVFREQKKTTPRQYREASLAAGRVTVEKQ